MKRDSDIAESQPSDRPHDPEDPGVIETKLKPVVTSWGFYCFANLAGWTQEDIERFAADLGVDPERIQIDVAAAGAKPRPEKQPEEKNSNDKE